MTYKLTIPFRLIGLNEYVNAERTHWSKASKIKKNSESDIILLCKYQLGKVKITKPVFMSYLWVEKDTKRDKDNIAFAKKFIQDALVKSGILQNDGWDFIDGFSDKFEIDRKNPRIEIIIEERE